MRMRRDRRSSSGRATLFPSLDGILKDLDEHLIGLFLENGEFTSEAQRAGPGSENLKIRVGASGGGSTMSSKLPDVMAFHGDVALVKPVAGLVAEHGR